MNESIVKVIVALIGLLGTVITAYAIPYFKAKTNEKTREYIFG